jgi:hypothetical protein
MIEREPWRVLVFPGATEIALEIRQALAWRKEIQLFSAGAVVSSHAPFVFAHHYDVPPVDQNDWLQALRQVVLAQRITHIFPAHDDALLALAENASTLGAKLVSSPVETCRITRSKSATLRLLRDVVPTPALFNRVEDVSAFPVFVKPDVGQGSQRTSTAHDREELDSLLARDPDRLVLEHLPGAEYTIDCFSDRERGLLYSAGRERRRMRSGIAMNSVFVNNPQFSDYAARITDTLALYGAWFFQVKTDVNGVLKLLEVAPRIGGTSALSRVRGVNLPLLSIYESERVGVCVAPTDISVEIDRALVNRYRHNLAYSTLYVDFDDTIVVHGRINTDLIKLLYQAFDRGVRLVLLTRHTGDMDTTLSRYRLKGLFDQVIQLRMDQQKAAFISATDAILIDDSFAEREQVRAQCGIPVMDSGGVELLMDHRV